MTGTILFVVLVLAVIAALEISNRRHTTGPSAGPRGTWVADDRDQARTKLDLLALGATAEPFNHKPAASAESVQRIHTVRITHGRHAA
jgi:hypothetical protein